MVGTRSSAYTVLVVGAILLLVPSPATSATSTLSPPHCDAGYEYSHHTRGCVPCRRHHYKPTAGPDTCVVCPTGVDGESGQTYGGNRTACQFRPYLATFTPQYGPYAGGTVITITAYHLHGKSITDVRLMSKPLTVMQFLPSNNTITVRTNPLYNHLNGGGRIHDNGIYNTSDDVTTYHSYIKLMMSHQYDEFIDVSDEVFTYRPDPVIVGIQDAVTILRGGTTLTVRGDNLLSVAHPSMVIARLYRQTQRREFHSPCNVSSNSEMLCVTPDLTPGLDLTQLANLTQDSAVRINDQRNNNNRYRRQTGEEEDNKDDANQPINDHNLEFYVWFELDGVQVNATTINVYNNPEVFRFPASDHVRNFRAARDQYIDILGRHMERGISQHEVTVTIGSGVCDLVYHSNDVLTCRPPPTAPTTGDKPTGPQKSVYVEVQLGAHMRFHVGYVRYMNTSDPVLLVMVPCVAGAVMLWVLALWCMICITKKPPTPPTPTDNINTTKPHSHSTTTSTTRNTGTSYGATTGGWCSCRPTCTWWCCIPGACEKLTETRNRTQSTSTTEESLCHNSSDTHSSLSGSSSVSETAFYIKITESRHEQ